MVAGGAEEIIVTWSTFESQQPINFLELLMAAWTITTFIWALANTFVLFSLDNTAAVHVIKRGSSRSPLMMEVTRRLLLLCMYYNIWLMSQHVPGEEHTRCDGLSRGEQPMAARQPLTEVWFNHFSALAGPWDVIIGRECKHVSQPFIGTDVDIASRRAYIHPRSNEVATTLLWILAAVKLT